MSSWLIALVTLIYIGVAISYWREGNTGMSIAFTGYAFANLGFIVAGVR